MRERNGLHLKKFNSGEITFSTLPLAEKSAKSEQSDNNSGWLCNRRAPA